MRPDPGKPYYTAYDKRYRSVYAQGVEYWTAHPEELAAVEKEVGDFLKSAGIPPEARIVEFGCGEGFVGEVLAGMGYRYTGIDIAAAAIEKAQKRLARFGNRASVFAADMLDLSALPDAAFDAGLDVSCLHMLVVDADRAAYLRNAVRVLRPGAPMLFCRQAFRVDAPPQAVTSYDEWLRMSGTDVDTVEEREAWHGGRSVKIQLPRIAARARAMDQYRAEMIGAGFTFLDGWIAASGRTASFHVKKPASAPILR